MAIKLTVFLTTTLCYILIVYGMRDTAQTYDITLLKLIKNIFQATAAIVLGVIASAFLINSFKTPKTQEHFTTIDTANVTVTLTQDKKTIPITDQTTTKDLKAISKGSIVLSDGQTSAKRSFDVLDIAKSGDTIDHLEYGTKTTYDDYFGDHLDKTSQHVLRVVLKPNAVEKRFN